VTTTRRVVGPLRFLLAVAFAALVLAQVFFLPALSAAMAADSPELAHLRWPTLGVAVLGLGCVEVVIVCTWKLLTLVEEDRIFSAASMVWVDTIVGRSPPLSCSSSARSSGPSWPWASRGRRSCSCWCSWPGPWSGCSWW
jgi:hypothetical protein